MPRGSTQTSMRIVSLIATYCGDMSIETLEEFSARISGTRTNESRRILWQMRLMYLSSV